MNVFSDSPDEAVDGTAMSDPNGKLHDFMHPKYF
jgi:hypothetical protein